MKNNVNERVKILRESLNLSQHEFYERTKVSVATLSRIENGEEIKQGTLHKIIFGTGVSQSWLVNGVGEMLPHGVSENNFQLTENPWKEEAYNTLKAENTFLKEQYQKLMDVFQAVASGGGKLGKLKGSDLPAYLLKGAYSGPQYSAVQ